MTDKRKYEDEPQKPGEDTLMQCGYERDFSPEQLLSVANLISRYGKVTVMVAGKPRMGKSTVFNNLFGLNLRAAPGASSVTTTVLDETISQNGVEVRYIDTPGVRAVDVCSENVLQDISATIGRGDNSFTLLYCVSAYSGFTEDDVKIVNKLNKRFGANIWKRCILVLTNCDIIRSQNFDTEKEDDRYKICLKAFAGMFAEILKKSKINAPPVKVIFEVRGKSDISAGSDGGAGVGASPDGITMADTIVAVPVAKSKKAGKDPNILPGIKIAGNLNWSDFVFMEILKKSGKFAISLLRFRYNLIIAESSKVTVDAVLSKLIAAVSTVEAHPSGITGVLIRNQI